MALILDTCRESNGLTYITFEWFLIYLTKMYPLSAEEDDCEPESPSPGSPNTSPRQTPLVEYKHANWLAGKNPRLHIDESVKEIMDEIICCFVVVETLRMNRPHT